jgi:hypothetical protein
MVYFFVTKKVAQVNKPNIYLLSDEGVRAKLALLTLSKTRALQVGLQEAC